MVQAMRAVLKRRASVHVVEKVLLLKAFAHVLKKRDVASKDTVRIEQFQAVWKAFGVVVGDEEAIALFNKYGQVLTNPKAVQTVSLSNF
jgi:echinoderm microtubule-associated protein-like 6